MNRRRFLRQFTTGGGVVASVAVAGCAYDRDTGRAAPGEGATETETPTPTPAPGIVVDGAFTHEVTDDGKTVVSVPVANQGEETATVVVEVRVTADGESFTDSQEVTLAAGDRETLEFEFDIDVEAADSWGIEPSIRPA